MSAALAEKHSQREGVSPQWDVENIRSKLATNTASVEWAILALDARQTSEERSAGVTIDENGRGWNYLANWIKTSRRPKGSRGPSTQHAPEVRWPVE